MGLRSSATQRAGAKANLRPTVDAGFTLIEVTVAMMIIAIVVTTLVALQLSSLKTITLAKQRDQATSLANQQIEAMRSLPYTKLRAGMLATDAAADTAWVTAGRLKAPWDEKLVTSTNQTEPALNPHVVNKTVGTQQYTVRSFVTSPKDDTTGADLPSTTDFWLTTVVEWSSSVTGGAAKQVTVRNREVFPAGCMGDTTHPYAGPCQPFFYGSAGWSGGGIKVFNADSSGGLLGSSSDSAEVILPGLSSSYSVEQTTSALSKATTSGTAIGGTGTGVVGNAAQASIDVASGTPRESGLLAVAQSGTAWQKLTGSAGELTVSASPSDAGANAATTAAADASACRDLSDQLLSGGDACASSTIIPGGVSSAQVDLATGGTDLPAFTLASISAPAAGAHAFTTRLLAPLPGHCVGTSGAGCSASGATRALGDITAGGLPAADLANGDLLPDGFTGAVAITGLAERATAEVGVGLMTGSLPVPSRFDVTRAGSMRLWNGSGYTSVDLANTALDGVYTIPETKATYQRPGNPVITVLLSGQVTMTAAKGPTRDVLPNCQPLACTGTSVGAGISISLTYTVSGQSGQVAHFTTQVDLGTVRAGTTYRAMP
jgi:prepilin-type N-terminal cleavage/methylation domain-containing protein